MKPAKFAYHAPKTLNECLRLLNEFRDDAALLAGGQSLLPLMRLRLATPANVVSIHAINGSLSSISHVGDYLAIGASVTYGVALSSSTAVNACPVLPKAIELIATPAIRSRGTVCGNLCQADPASELPAIALIMGARFRLGSTAGERVVDAQDFFLGPYTTARRADEMLTSVEFPKRSPNENVVIKEVTRQRGGFAMSGVAVALTRGEGSKLRSVSVACFGVNPKQIRIKGAEASLEAHGYTRDGIAGAVHAIASTIQPHSDVFATAEYRKSATCTLFRRALEEACQRQAIQ